MLVGQERNQHTSLVYKNKMWVIGGFDINRKNDVWHSRDGSNWVQATGDAGWSVRSGHSSLVYDDKMWVLGGNVSSTHINDVWYSTNGINWEQATASAAWSSRDSHTSLVYDNKMWVLGGENDGSGKNDVWYSRDGSNWEQATASADWSGNWRHTSLVYDNKMWVIGGYDGYYHNNIWYSRDGSNWEQVTTNNVWPRRNNHTSLVYDNKIWVLGGQDDHSKNDVWYSRDGSNWEQVTTNNVWPRRSNHTSLVYDNKMWVIGGYDGSHRSDVWFTFTPNDSTGGGRELVLGEKVISLLDANEKEYYYLPLSAGSYQIATEGSTDTLCSLYNNSNELLASNNNDGIEENCSFVFSTSATIDVNLLVQGANSGANSGANTGANTGANSRATGDYFLSIIPIAPDVDIRSLDIGSLGTNIFYEGETAQIITEIENIGIRAANNITIKYYFPQNSQINPIIDTPDYTSNIANLGVGAIETNISNDISVDIGDYYYGVCLETTNEVNLTNNCLFKFRTVSPHPKPDIAVNIAVPDVVFLDETTATIELQATFSNQGGLSEPIVFNYYKSLTAITTSDSNNLISSIDISAKNQFSKNGLIFYRSRGVSGGASDDATADTTVRSRGIFYYGVCIENVRGDKITTDNCASQRVIVTKKANLGIANFQENKATSNGEGGVQLTMSVRNNSSSQEYTVVRYFRSIDNIITTGDAEIGISMLETLAANTTQDISLNLIPEGSYYYGACVDNSIYGRQCSNAIFIGRGSAWKQATGSAVWSARNSHRSLIYDNKMWVLGGWVGYRINDVWNSRDGSNWVEVTANANLPVRGNYTVLVYANKMWVLGGTSGSRRNDVWHSTDGSNWEQATASADWLARRESYLISL